ncbi:MAG: NAD-dependent epimerase/dehydratase [uncultured bacterium]|nr:MAG: NAD-dependent epimerase/dehydratase [uncultured bacterium]
MNNRKKILILGGEGFIGRNIAKHLSIENDCFSLGIEKSPFIERKDEFMEGNPYKDKISGEYDVVIHLIDNATAQDDFKQQELNLLKNITFVDTGHCILFSSAVIYANPDSEYAKRKILLEETCKAYCKKNNINLTIFRLFNIYGEYQIPFKQGSLVANLLVNYLDDATTEINDMSAERDFIFASDMVKFIKYAIDNSYFGCTDLATEKLIKVGELIDIIENEVVMEKIKINDKGNKEDVVCPIAKNNLIGKIILTPIEEGLRKTLDFYRNNMYIINQNKK